MMKKFALAGMIFCAVTSQQVLGMNLQDDQDMYNAIEKNDLDKLISLLGKNVNHPFIGGRTALHYAVLKNKPEIVRALVDKGANVGLKTNNFKNTSLHHAIESRNLKIIETLLSSPSATEDAINAKNSMDETALCNATQAGFLEGIKKLIAKGADIHFQKYDPFANKNHSLIDIALAHNHFEVAEYFETILNPKASPALLSKLTTLKTKLKDFKKNLTELAKKLNSLKDQLKY